MNDITNFGMTSSTPSTVIVHGTSFIVSMKCKGCMALEKSWRDLRSVTMNNNRCLWSAVCMCTYVYCICIVPNSVTRKELYMQKVSRGHTKSQFCLKSKVSLKYSIWPQTPWQSTVQVSTKRCDGRPTGSKYIHLSHSFCRRPSH